VQHSNGSRAASIKIIFSNKKLKNTDKEEINKTDKLD
jgi:hypothetical protein